MSKQYRYKFTSRWTIQDTTYLILGLFSIFVVISSIAAWLTHVIWSIKLLMAATTPLWNQVVLAVIGALFAPVGVIHGWILWFS